MDSAWAHVLEGAQERVEASAQVNLAEELKQTLAVNKALLVQGAETVFGKVVNEATGERGEPSQKPASYRDGERAIRTASHGILTVAQTLSGGEPLLPVGDGVDGVFKWNEPGAGVKGKKPKARKPEAD